jgi:hypothetical protein
MGHWAEIFWALAIWAGLEQADKWFGPRWARTARQARCWPQLAQRESCAPGGAARPAAALVVRRLCPARRRGEWRRGVAYSAVERESGRGLTGSGAVVEAPRRCGAVGVDVGGVAHRERKRTVPQSSSPGRRS